MEIQTGGELKVTGTIAFTFNVRSADCNVFTLSELKTDIESNIINWFIDYYLESGVASDGSTVESEERYNVLELDIRPTTGDDIEATVEMQTVDKYLVRDPEVFGFDNMHVQIDKDDKEYP